NLWYKKPNTLANRELPSNDKLLIVPTECSDDGKNSLDNDYNNRNEENDNTIQTIDLSTIETWKKQFINID
ncbi:38712_t:CDS:1, partial [Gigaspora margarita]